MRFFYIMNHSFDIDIFKKATHKSMNLKDKVVIITGASSGIGAELAIQFAQKGSRVVLAARNKNAIDSLAQKIRDQGGQAHSIQTDVSIRSQVETCIEEAVQKFGRIDILINNAGVSLAQGPLIENKEEDVRSTMEINFMGGVYGVWAAVPYMKKTGGGQIVFVSSCIGKRGVPRNAIYCASKFAIQGLTEALRLELQRKKIHVLTVCPPGVNTPFFINNKKKDVRTYHLHSVQKISKMIVRACEKEKREVLLTLDSKLLHWLNVFFPKLMDRAISIKKGV